MLPCPDRHTEAPCSSAGQGLGSTDALCLLQPPGVGLPRGWALPDPPAGQKQRELRLAHFQSQGIERFAYWPELFVLGIDWPSWGALQPARRVWSFAGSWNSLLCKDRLRPCGRPWGEFEPRPDRRITPTRRSQAALAYWAPPGVQN